ncbi:WD40 repeat-like protein [Pisolithus croceorrhizus]|nr:WD40 repeat-like protein [Pisolithus croceorrhizus]
MAHSDSEGETIDDLEFETRTTDADGDEDNEIDEDLLGAIENGVEDASEAEEESPTDDSDDEDDEDEDDIAIELPLDVDPVPSSPAPPTSRQLSPQSATPDPPEELLVRPQSPSPAEARKRGLLFFPSQSPRSFTVEAVCAIPHPVPTHSLASSFCMSHLLSGSEDGYIRDYDIFTSVNGKITLTAPQRHHCNVVEGNMKAGQIRCWWENPDYLGSQVGYPTAGESLLSPVYSLAMHSDALWALGGTQRCHINLFTVRHDPGRLIHVLYGHRGPVSALSVDHDEKGLFSASWDGEAMQWDLNTGQVVRKFTAHGAQLVAIAVRPLNPLTRCFSSTFSAGTAGEWDVYPPSSAFMSHKNESDASMADVETSPVSADDNGRPVHEIQHPRILTLNRTHHLIPLFDDEPDADGEVDSTSPVDGSGANQTVNFKKESASMSRHASLAVPDAKFALPNQQAAAGDATNAPPLLNPESSAAFSPDILMIAAIDGQVMLWDKRVNTPGRGVGRLWMSEKTPPWCVSVRMLVYRWAHVYAGRRNGTVDVWDVRLLGCSRPSGTPRLLRSLRNPPSSGVVSCVVPFPDGRHIACASVDNIRLWNAAEAGETDGNVKSRGGVPFKIIPGHHGGYVSQMLVDPGARFLVSASSNRGWHGDSTRTVFVHDIKPIP